MTDIEPTNLEMTRLFDAPRELVWQAFVDPDQISQWFGPVTYTVPRDTVDVDLRVGGHLRFVMVSLEDDEEKAPINSVLEEVVENELLVFVEQFDGVKGEPGDVDLRCRLEFHDAPGGKTRLVLTQGPFNKELTDMTNEGWESSFTKLDTLLATARA